jgi:hypothetical protein
VRPGLAATIRWGRSQFSDDTWWRTAPLRQHLKEVFGDRVGWIALREFKTDVAAATYMPAGEFAERSAAEDRETSVRLEIVKPGPVGID